MQLVARSTESVFAGVYSSSMTPVIEEGASNADATRSQADIVALSPNARQGEPGGRTRSWFVSNPAPGERRSAENYGARAHAQASSRTAAEGDGIEAAGAAGARRRCAALRGVAMRCD